MDNQENQQEPTTNKTSPALWVSIILVIIVLAVGAYFVFIQDGTINTNNANTTPTNIVSNTNTETNTNVVVNTNTMTNTDIDTSGNETYTNQELDFTLQIPKNWSGYSSSQYTSIHSASNEPVDYSTVVFEHPKTESEDGLPGKVGFSIYYFENLETEMPQGVQLLKQNGDIRYGVSKSNAATPGELNDLWNEIDTITASLITL